jgi:hypothetical protein
MMSNYIAVDFDATLIDHRFPNMGPDVPLAVETLKVLSTKCSIILNTMRSGRELEDAVQWFKDKDIPLSGINSNPSQTAWTMSPKCYANIYIDDAAYGAPLIKPDGFERPCLDWRQVKEYVEGFFGIQFGE